MEKISNRKKQLELAQGQASWRGVIVILWSLIFAKSFCLQWLALKYAIPVNMVVFVWIPTYIFAGLGTWMYVATKKNEAWEVSMESMLVRGLWQCAFVVMGVLAAMALVFKKFDALLLPGMFALVLGMVYYLYFILQRIQLQLICALGWLLGGVWLLYYMEVGALGLFSAMILLFQVAPSVALYWMGRKQMDLMN